jgi:hypothetical protein
MPGPPLEPDLPEPSESDFVGLIFRRTPDQQGHSDIFERRKLGKQRWILPYEPNFGISELGQLTLIKLSDVPRSILDASLVGALQPTQEME